MTFYGGLGGITGGRPLRTADAFEAAVARALGERMKSDDDLCTQVWSALANQNWHHDNGDTAGYSFRAAGDLVAAVSSHGDYVTWYCSGPDAVVSEDVRTALAAEGWHPDDD